MFELGCEPGDFVEHHAEQEPLQGPQADAGDDRPARGGRPPQAPPPRTRSSGDYSSLPRPALRERVGVRAAFSGDAALQVAPAPWMAIFTPWPSTRCPICPTTTARSSRTSRARSCSCITTSITRAYVAGANDALDGLAEARAQDDFSRIAALERALAFNVSGHVLHSLFWQNLAPEAGGEPTGALGEQIDARLRQLRALPRRSSPTPR